MERYIGSDAHATSCTFAVLSERGRRLDSAVVETNGHALVKFLRGVPGILLTVLGGAALTGCASAGSGYVESHATTGYVLIE